MALDPVALPPGRERADLGGLVERVTDLPRSAAGKVLKHELRGKYGEPHP